MREQANMPRPYPGGGWYCEVGTGPRSRTPACTRRATWTIAGCPPGRRPGAMVCDEHRTDPHLTSINRVIWVPIPEPVDGPASALLQAVARVRDVLGPFRDGHEPTCMCDLCEADEHLIRLRLDLERPGWLYGVGGRMPADPVAP